MVVEREDLALPHLDAARHAGLAATFRTHLLTERTAAISTKLRIRGVIRIAVRTAIRQRAPALGTEFLAGDSFCPALRAAHPMSPTRPAAPWRP